MAFFLPLTSQLIVGNEPRFTFRQRYGKINWRLVQQVDIDEAVQLGDSSKLALVKETLTYSHFEQDDLERYSEGLIVKAFRLVQFLIEFQDYEISRLTLEGDRHSGEFKAAHETITDLQARVKTLEEELATATKELKNKVHILSTYEYILRQPSATGLVSQMLSQHNAVKCPHCMKLFMSSTFLEQHIEKRHQVLTQSLQVESRTQEHNREMEATLESMKLLMARNIQTINESHAKQIEAMQTAFQRRLEEMEQTKADMEKSRPGTADTVDLAASESALREVLRAQQEFRSSMEARDQSLKDQLRHIEERQLSAFSETHKNEETFRTHIEEMIKKHVESLPTRARRPPSADPVLQRSDESQNEESEDGKGRSNAGDIESDEGSNRFGNVLDEQVTTTKRRQPGMMSANPSDSADVREEPELPAAGITEAVLERAAAELGVQRTEAANVEFVVRAYAKAKQQSPWQEVVREGRQVFQNQLTGEVVGEHPDMARFRQSLHRAQQLSERIDYSSFLSLKSMNVTQTTHCHDGISTIFSHKVATFQKHVGENKKKISSSVARLKDRLAENLSDLRARHQERVNSEPAYRRHLEEVTDEADGLLTKALARRSLVEPAKTIFGKQMERRFAEDSAKKILIVDERYPRNSL